ncbi:MAG: toxin-antitoxin system HicB family antitoxin [Chloroflexi bacterium]|nr:toxin-antitoxin system HicB family antitoxin [Chloroflexota bacterium]
MPKSLHRRVMTRAKHEGVSMNQFIATTLAEAIGPAAREPGPRHVGSLKVAPRKR